MRQVPPAPPSYVPLTARRLEEWHDKTHIRHSGHSAAARINEVVSRGLGTFVAVATAFAGTTLFATLESSTSGTLQLSAAILAGLGAILSAVQTSLAPGSRAANHHMAASRYGALRREMEQWRVAHPESAVPADAVVARWLRDWKKAEGEAPELSGHQLERATRRIQTQKRTSGEPWFPTHPRVTA